MTQEQKPTFRTREDQSTALSLALGPEKVFHRLSKESQDNIISLSGAHIVEAEARGASDQRRKDREEAKPLAWVRAEDIEHSSTWADDGDSGFRILEHRSSGSEEFSVPVYISPVNISAYEEWVKEIQAQVDKKVADAVAAERERCAKIIEDNWEFDSIHEGQILIRRGVNGSAGLTYADAIREGNPT